MILGRYPFFFERFISKERDEPPDIDVDFEHERREEVIQYIYKKYGRERAALAATVITYRFKSAIRDVGRALGIEASQLDFFIRNVDRRDRKQDWQAQIVALGLEPSSLKGQQFIELVNRIIGFPAIYHNMSVVLLSPLDHFMTWFRLKMQPCLIGRSFNGIKMT